MNLCDYGCGQQAIFIFKNGKKSCSKNHKSCPSLKNKGIPDPKTNIANSKVFCRYCKKEVAYSGISKHERSCYLNPDNLILCLYCKSPVKRGYTYCNSSCYALHSVPGRKHTEATKQKISESLKGEDTFCVLCNIQTIDRRQYCEKCIVIYRSTCNGIKQASLSFSYYEKELSEILEHSYGKLNKENINGVYPDFCNKSYIIDFTFDHTKGTSDLVKRFKKITNDPRKKIAYIPYKGSGYLRRNALIKMGIEIKDSIPFINLIREINERRM